MFVMKQTGAELEADEFMNSKKSHEVQSMSEVVACLAQNCGVKQVEQLFSDSRFIFRTSEHRKQHL